MNVPIDLYIRKLDEVGCQVCCWGTPTDKRVYRATLQPEAHGMSLGIEVERNTPSDYS